MYTCIYIYIHIYVLIDPDIMLLDIEGCWTRNVSKRTHLVSDLSVTPTLFVHGGKKSTTKQYLSSQ